MFSGLASLGLSGNGGIPGAFFLLGIIHWLLPDYAGNWVEAAHETFFSSDELEPKIVGSTAVVAFQTDKEFLDETARWLAGDNPQLADALPSVYEDLRRLAASYLRGERTGHTLQPTALVHEAYLRLHDQRQVDWGNRAQFLGVAARMMRRILVNHAEARGAKKRGSGVTPVTLDAALHVFDKQDVSALEVNRALHELEALDPRQAQIAELRFFGGLTVEETGEALGISPATVKREWNVAKLWLEREMSR